MKNKVIIIVITFLFALSGISALSPVINVSAGLAERQNALEALALIEIRVYTGNKGTIGMEGASHPSILYRLIDAKINNDNSLLGSTDELENDLSSLQQCIDSLVSEDDDISLLQEESQTATGYTFTKRIDILNSKIIQVKELIPECGLNNVNKIQGVINICDDAIVNLEEIFSIFGVVVFPDPALEVLVRDAISKPTGEIYEDDLLVITSLDAKSKGIWDISGLEYCINLQDLDLSWNNLRQDITPGVLSPLSGLTNLQILNLDVNMIFDFSPLSGLTDLQELSLFWQTTSTKDIGPLAGLANLKELNVGRNAIVDISPVSGLINLEHLNLEGNDIVDLSPVSGLTNLQGLYLHGNEVVDISPVSGLTNLEHLYLTSNEIFDISPLLDCLNSGDRVTLSDNPLDPETAPSIVAELESRGVTVIL